jgi:biotin carboxylase
MTRVLLLSHTTGYQLRAFNDAAQELGIELMFATDRCRNLDDPWQDHAVAVRFYEIDTSVAAILRAAAQRPLDGVIAVGDRPVVLAAHAAEALGLPWHTTAGATASADKRRSRAAIAAAGLPSPKFAVLPVGTGRDANTPDPNHTAHLRYPVVLKPLGLSGSRGVIRADTNDAFLTAVERIAALLSRPQIRKARTGLEDEILVEEYIDGAEFALEGVMTRGALTTFAIFDKPDPLDGPFFEETIYVTPSRWPESVQTAIARHMERAAAALGLHHGPVHAECRVTSDGTVYVLEVAGRPIGGLCSKVLTLTGASARGASLESVLLCHAIGASIEEVRRESRAAAVMMIPIPRRGFLKGVTGQEAARSISDVQEVRITAKRDQLLEPLPEAGSYLGFIFSRAGTPEAAERAVRDAHAQLAFDISRDIPVETRS